MRTGLLGLPVENEDIAAARQTPQSRFIRRCRAVEYISYPQPGITLVFLLAFCVVHQVLERRTEVSRTRRSGNF